ncbi:AsmA family protein [Neopusillimonas maritima]|nr:AsmA family protein [Neopusillimonas maritima]
MKVWIKRVLIGLVAVFFLVLLGIAVFLLTFDPNSYKARVQDEVFQRYQRTLNIEGDIALSVFPRLGLTVNKISLSEPNSDLVFASIDHARIAVAIWPLVSNRLVVDHIALDGFKAWLKRSPEGEFNFEDLIHATGSDAAVAQATEILAPPAKPLGIAEAQASDLVTGVPDERTDLQVDIAGLELRNSEVHYFDAKDGYDVRIVGVQLNTGRITFDQPFDVSLNGRLQGSLPATDAQIQGQAAVRIDPVKREYSAQRINVRMVGSVHPFQAESASLRGNLAYSAFSQHLNAGNLDFEMQGRIAGQTPVESLSLELTAPRLRVDPSRRELQVQDLAIRGSGDMPDGNALIELDAPRLLISPEKAEGETVLGTLKLEGESVLGVALEMTGLSGNALDLNLKELKVDGNLKQGDRLIQVDMSSPVRWNAINEQLGLTAIKGDVQINAPVLGDQGFEFPLIGSLAVDFLKSTLSSDMNAVLNGSQLSLKTRVDQLDKPVINLDLNAEELDFDKLFPPVQVAKSEESAKGGASENQSNEAVNEQANQGAAKGEPAKASEPAVIDLTFLNELNLTANAKIGRLAGRGFEASDVVAAVLAKQGRLDVTRLTGKLYDGSFTGKAGATVANEFSTQLNLSSVSVGPLMRAITGEERVTGTGNVSLRLSTQGETVRALPSALAGDAKIAVRDGAIKGIDLPRILGRASQAIKDLSGGTGPSLGISENLDDETTFTSLDADLRFAEGVGTLRKLAIQAPLLRITQGKPATIDVGKQVIDLVVNVRVVDTLRGQGAEQLAQLRGVTVPLRVNGPFNALNYGVEWKGIGEAAIKRVLEQGLESGLKSLLEGQTKPADGGAATAPEPAANDPVKNIGEALKGLIGR